MVEVESGDEVVVDELKLVVVDVGALVLVVELLVVDELVVVPALVVEVVVDACCAPAGATGATVSAKASSARA